MEMNPTSHRELPKPSKIPGSLQNLCVMIQKGEEKYRTHPHHHYETLNQHHEGVKTNFKTSISWYFDLHAALYTPHKTYSNIVNTGKTHIQFIHKINLRPRTSLLETYTAFDTELMK